MGGVETRGQRNIRWIEKYCWIPEGKFVGQRVRLRSWQKREIRRIYDNPADTRTAILSYARKNAKTAKAAFLLLLHLVGPESQPNSQLVSTATSREQAAFLFDLASKIIRMSPLLVDVVGIRDHLKQLYCANRGTLYRALSSDAATNVGASPVFAVHDELGQVVGPRSALYDAVESGMGAHDRPLSVIISTQARTDGDLLSILIDDSLAGHDPRITVSLYTAPIDDNPFLVSTIRKANPAYGDFLNPDELKKQANDAKRMPAREAGYRNLNLNQRVNVTNPFITPAVWSACSGAPFEEAFAKGPVRVGLDLSARHDLTAIVYQSALDGEYHVRAEFFVPLEGIAERSHIDRVPYDMWHQQGFITATPGASVDYEIVAQRLIDLCDKYDVEGIAFDRWRIDVLERELAKLGAELPLIPHGQGFKDMSLALDILEGELLNGRVRHGDNPVLTMCAANSIVDSDPAGNRKLNKRKSTGRIDGMVSLAMCMNHPAPEVSEYVSGGLVAL